MNTARALRMRNKVHNIIVREGQPGILRNTSGDRACFVMEDAYAPREIDGTLIQLGDRRYFLSALATGDSDSTTELSPAPNAHTDRLVLADPMDESSEIELLLASPPVRAMPGTVIVYFELHCREP